MQNKNWHGLMKILEVQQWDSNGKLLWEQKNIRNNFHLEGEEFLLRAAFTGGRVSSIIPDLYYLGLDNRSTVTPDQTMDDLTGEPTSAGYERQEVASAGDFLVSFENNHYVAISPVVTFRATSGTWGPCRCLFLTNKADNSGSLIATATTDSAIQLSTGDSVTMRIGMKLQDPECD